MLFDGKLHDAHKVICSASQIDMLGWGHSEWRKRPFELKYHSIDPARDTTRPGERLHAEMARLKFDADVARRHGLALESAGVEDITDFITLRSPLDQRSQPAFLSMSESDVP